jgi:uncharacterized protein (DUF1330 family)
MTAYIIFTREGPVRDEAEMKTYQSSNAGDAGKFVEQYGLKPLVVYGAMEALEGDAPDGAVVLQFPTMDAARDWHNSPEYQKAVPHRLKAADYRAFIVQGL